MSEAAEVVDGEATEVQESIVTATPGESSGAVDVDSESEMYGDFAAQLDEVEGDLGEEGDAQPTPADGETSEVKPGEESEALEKDGEKDLEVVTSTEETTEVVEAVATATEEDLISKTPEELQADYDASRGVILEGLEKEFAVSEEDADMLLTNPQEVLPKMLAKAFLNTYESVMRGVHVTMPGMIQQVSSMSTEQGKAEASFYEAWPVLQTEEHKAAVFRIGAMYRKMNPQATVEEFIQDVGAQAVVSLKLPMPGAESVELPAGAAAASDIPAHTPPRSTNVAPVTTLNEFEKLSLEFDDEED